MDAIISSYEDDFKIFLNNSIISTKVWSYLRLYHANTAILSREFFDDVK